MEVVARLKQEGGDRLARIADFRATGFLGNVVRRISRKPRPLPMYWFRAKTNFGDLLSSAVVQKLWNVQPMHVSNRFKGKLLAIGSVVGAAKPNDIVWGSGLISPKRVDGAAITFLAVRGPRTRANIDGDVPEVYGDPAIVLPLIYKPPQVVRGFRIGLVPHYVDRLKSPPDPAVLWIDVQDPDWRATVDRIVSCEMIISSSLHGIVAAEAYGVPAVWVRPQTDIIGGDFKFLDYYESTGRFDQQPADFNRGLNYLERSASSPPILDSSALLKAMTAWMSCQPG